MACCCSSNKVNAAASAAGGSGGPATILIDHPFNTPVLPSFASRVATVTSLPGAAEPVAKPNWVLLGIIVLALGFWYLNTQKGRK